MAVGSVDNIQIGWLVRVILAGRALLKQVQILRENQKVLGLQEKKFLFMIYLGRKIQQQVLDHGWAGITNTEYLVRAIKPFIHIFLTCYSFIINFDCRKFVQPFLRTGIEESKTIQDIRWHIRWLINTISCISLRDHRLQENPRFDKGTQQQSMQARYIYPTENLHITYRKQH